MERYDLVGIGCGPAGEKGTVQAARLGPKVLVVEKEASPGGVMVHTGTLASKSLRESALVISGMRRQGFGVETGLGRLPTIEELGNRRVEVARAEAGRQSNVEELALDKAGVVTSSRGLVTVNERMQTDVPHIYAAGDVIGFPALASTSMEQGRVAMCHAFESGYKTRLSTLLSYAIYTIPECSYIGLSEQEARDGGLEYVVGRSQFADNARGQITSETGFLKLVVDATDKRILGAHIVCERASELIHVVQAHMSHGATIEHVIEQVFNYPTLGEAFKYAAYEALGRLSDRRGGR